MLIFLLYVILASIAISFLASTFLVLQLVWDRFWTISFPILLEVYGRIRYPQAFTDNED